MKYLRFLVVASIGAALRAGPIDLKESVGPNNRFTDSAFGVALTYPAGWRVRGASRWGEHEEQNTVFLQPLWPSEASPSVYYQRYPADTPTPIADLQAYFRRVAEQKAASRVQGFKDYVNVPESFAFRTIAGRPSCSYLATFTHDGQPMAEYFIRIAGEKSYVMFFTMAPAAEIDALRPQIDRMAESVQLP